MNTVEAFETLQGFIEGEGDKPSEEEALAALDYLKENC